MEINPDILQREIDRLRRLYQGFPLEPVIWERDGRKRSPYRVLIVMGLSPRVSDVRGIKVWERFLWRYPNPDELKQGWRRDRESVLRVLDDLGNCKHTGRIIDTAVNLSAEIPSEVRQLKRYPGIGPTIAEKIRGYGFGKPALPLDSHGCAFITRVCKLDGPSRRRTADDLREEVKEIFDESEWMEVHELLRLDGQCSRSPPETVMNRWNKWRALLIED